jgi:hypothetical protein
MTLKKTKSMKLRKVGEWQEMKDPETGALFYFSESRNVFKWEMPPEFMDDDVVEQEKTDMAMKRTKSMTTRKRGEWEEMKDPETGALFYYNHKTGANLWEMPPEFKQDDADEQKEWGMRRTKSMKLRKIGEWEEMKDPDSGALYYYNHKTGVTQWEALPEFQDSPSAEDITPAETVQKGMTRKKSMRLRKVGEWEELKEEESGKIFFYNHKTGVSQWDAPPGFEVEVKADDKFTLSDSSDMDSDPNLQKEWGMKRTKSMRLRKFGDWEELKEEESGKIFFYNKATGVSQWNPPAEFSEQGDHIKTLGDWEELKDETSGKMYFYNKATGVTQWEMPEDFKKTEWSLKRKTSMKLVRIGDWEQFKDAENNNQLFYYNHITGESLWEAPECFKDKSQMAAALIAQQSDSSAISGGESTDGSELHLVDDTYSALGI